MTNFNDSRIQHSLTTGFKSSLFPLYDISVEPAAPVTSSNPVLSSIEQISVNIYCPYQRVHDYEHLICEEVALRRSLSSRHQPVASVWWLGNPLQQFSPEAITELCFRLSSHFTHLQEGSIRGMVVTPMELDKNSLALLKGLNFNAIKLNIDACVASGDRSLSKTEMVLKRLADYKSFSLSCHIKFSDQTHQDFLERLLKLLEDSHCIHIEVSSHKSGPVSLQERLACQNQLASINAHFRDYDWLGCGNNSFFAPSHPMRNSYQLANLEATPWGYQTRPFSSWLGFGISALSLNNGAYQYNTPSSERYVALLAEKIIPVESNFCLQADKAINLQIIQDLLCRHSVDSTDLQLYKKLNSLIPSEWLKESQYSVKLNTAGIVNLSSICDKLFDPIFA